VYGLWHFVLRLSIYEVSTVFWYKWYVQGTDYRERSLMLCPPPLPPHTPSNPRLLLGTISTTYNILLHKNLSDVYLQSQLRVFLLMLLYLSVSQWPYSRFSRQEPLLFYQVAPQLYSRGWVDPAPDPLLFFVVPGNRTRDPCICSQELRPLGHRGGLYGPFYYFIVFIVFYLFQFNLFT
jgi:hypothetical protein